MADIRFYHLEQSTLDQALPAITTKAFQTNKKIIIRVPDQKEASRLNDLLWTFRADSFLPHGMNGNNDSSRQPILITDGDENDNQADILILTHGCVVDDIDQFSMVCELLDGRVETHVKEARSRWKTYKEQGHDLTYWQQNDKGQWNKK